VKGLAIILFDLITPKEIINFVNYLYNKDGFRIEKNSTLDVFIIFRGKVSSFTEFLMEVMFSIGFIEKINALVIGYKI